MSNLNAEHLKVAIVMINRAPCKGEESLGVAVTLQALQAEYQALTGEVVGPGALPATEESNGDDD